MFRWLSAVFLVILLPCSIAADSYAASDVEMLWVTNNRYNRSNTSLHVFTETAERLFSGMSVNEVRSQKGFSDYYLNLASLENRDFLFDAVSETVFGIDVKPLVSLSSVTLFSRINAPLNYFSYLSKLGGKIREIAFKRTEKDISTLDVERYVSVQKMSLYDDFSGYIPIPETPSLPFENSPRGLIEQIFAESVWQLSFQKQGYAPPVVFSGFVDPVVAKQVLNNALFLDDTVFGLSWGHGKFSHLIQLGMLFDSGAINKQWLASMVSNGEWPHLFDRSMTGWSDVVLSAPGRMSSHRIKTVPGFSSPNAMQESLVLHQFSKLVNQMAADSVQPCHYLNLFFGQKTTSPDVCRQRLGTHASNLRNLENWVIFDFIDDLHLMREMASGSLAFQNELSTLIKGTRREKKLDNPLKEVAEVLACRDESDCLKRFVLLIGEIACMATFHNSVVEPFIGLRQQFYLQQGYSVIHQGNDYRVYLLPERQKVCDH